MEESSLRFLAGLIHSCFVSASGLLTAFYSCSRLLFIARDLPTDPSHATREGSVDAHSLTQANGDSQISRFSVILGIIVRPQFSATPDAEDSPGAQ